MRLIRNRWFIVGAVVVLLVATSALLMARNPEAEDTALVARVKKGEFKVIVNTSGELRARKFVQITVPPNAQQAQQWQRKIASLVPEGTVVKEGDIVAELDRSGIAARHAEVSLSLQKAQAQFEQAMLDSTLNLSKAREEIRSMDLGLEEKKLAKEQAVFEAPTVKRQAEIDYEKATRALAQAKTDYKTKTEQAQAKMREVGAERDRFANQLKVVSDVMVGFTIKAPAGGMVIYSKEWNGKKRTVGSQVNAWEATVATLPDLTLMESVTYVNEIDVRKIGVGQSVVITLDSDPSKKLTGKVTAVANVGEQRPNTDAKVFEVKVEVAQADTTLRPGMTTGNAIETARIANALYVPIEAVTADSGIAVVYKRSGTSVAKQEIQTGTMSDDEVVVLRGLDADDRVLLSPPADRDHMKIARLGGSPVNTAPLGGGDSARGAVLQTGQTKADSAKGAMTPGTKLPLTKAPPTMTPGTKAPTTKTSPAKAH
jgi:hypothetical protein